MKSRKMDLVCFVLTLTFAIVTSQYHTNQAQQYTNQAHTGGFAAMQMMHRVENELTSAFMDDVIDRLFDRVKCSQRISDDCKTCLTGVRLFQMVNATSGYLTAGMFEQAAKLMLCYARDLESLCEDHDDDDDFDRCDNDMTSLLADVANPASLTSSNVANFLSGLSDIYEDRLESAEDAAEDTAEENDEEEDEEEEADDEESGEDDVEDLVEDLTAALYSANCVSTDKLFDELGLDDDDDVPDTGSIGGLSALILFHLVNGDKISPSCRNLPDQSSFLDDIFDDTEQKTSMNYEEFNDLLEDLNIGSVQTAASARAVSSANVFTGNSRVARDVHLTSSRVRRSAGTPFDPRPRREVTISSMKTDRCFSRDELLVMVKADKYGGVSRKRFTDICPALVQQQVSTLCDTADVVQTEQSKKYVYTTLAGLLVCACSLLGAILIPCLGKPMYQTTLVLLMGLAMGSLTAHAFMQLLPRAFGIHGGVEGRSYRRRVLVHPSWYSLVAFFSMYMLYIVECLIEKSRCPPKNGNDEVKSDTEVNGNSTQHFKLKDVPDNLKQLYSKGLSPTVIVVSVTDFLHKLAAGLAIGVAFSASYTLGLGTAVSIILQHVCHELGQTAVLLNAGLNMTQTLGLRVCLSLVTMLGAYVGASTGNPEVQKWVFAATAGMFVYIALSKIVPNIVSAIQQTDFGYKFLVHNVGIIIGAALIVALCALDMNTYG